MACGTYDKRSTLSRAVPARFGRPPHRSRRRRLNSGSLGRLALVRTVRLFQDATYSNA